MKIALVEVPDSKLVRDAMDLAKSSSPPVLFNHVMRSWLFSAYLSQLEKTSVDPELLAVASVLHDLGLVPAFEGSERFEVDGANAARAFLRERHVGEADVQLVWDAIALHSTRSIALHKQPVVSACHHGIFTDVVGLRLEQVPKGQLDAILETFPRLALNREIKTALCSLVERKPQTTYDNFVSDLGRRYVPGYEPPNFSDALLNAPYGD